MLHSHFKKGNISIQALATPALYWSAVHELKPTEIKRIPIFEEGTSQLTDEAKEVLKSTFLRTAKVLKMAVNGKYDHSGTPIGVFYKRMNAIAEAFDEALYKELEEKFINDFISQTIKSPSLEKYFWKFTIDLQAMKESRTGDTVRILNIEHRSNPSWEAKSFEEQTLKSKLNKNGAFSPGETAPLYIWGYKSHQNILNSIFGADAIQLDLRLGMIKAKELGYDPQKRVFSISVPKSSKKLDFDGVEGGPWTASMHDLLHASWGSALSLPFRKFLKRVYQIAPSYGRKQTVHEIRSFSKEGIEDFQFASGHQNASKFNKYHRRYSNSAEAVLFIELFRSMRKPIELGKRVFSRIENPHPILNILYDLAENPGEYKKLGFNMKKLDKGFKEMVEFEITLSEKLKAEEDVLYNEFISFGNEWHGFSYKLRSKRLVPSIQNYLDFIRAWRSGNSKEFCEALLSARS